MQCWRNRTMLLPARCHAASSCHHAPLHAGPLNLLTCTRQHSIGLTTYCTGKGRNTALLKIDRVHDRRSCLLLGLGTAFLPAITYPSAAADAASIPKDVVVAFMKALNTNGSFEERDAAWSKVIDMAPTNSAAWSNRGVLRLQFARWQDAEKDLAQAVLLEARQADGSRQQVPLASGDVTSAVAVLDPAALSSVDASTLNNLGNAEVAMGKLSLARAHYTAAAKEAGLTEIALTNLALAAFEDEDSITAVKTARQVLRRDPVFLDARAALVAFLYGSGQVSSAEEQWEELQQAEDGLGGYLYSKSTAIARVRNRWPPRATAALDAFLSVSYTGTAQGYDLQLHTYEFSGRN